MERFKTKNKTSLFKASLLKTNNRIDPLYYKPGKHAERLRAIRESEHAVPLTDLITPVSEFISRSKKNKTNVRYIEVSDTDKKSGKILQYSTYMVCDLPQRAKYIIRENNILIPNHRNSINAKRSIVIVPPEYDGAVCTSRFIVVRSKVPPLYLYYILNLNFIKESMLRLVSGSSSSEVKYDQLKDIYIPIPPGEDYDLFIDSMSNLHEEITDLEYQLNDKKSKLEKQFIQLYKIEKP